MNQTLIPLARTYKIKKESVNY